MDFNNITIGQLVVSTTSCGVIVAFLWKCFSFFSQVKTNTKDIAKANERIDKVVIEYKKEKDELIDKVEETNKAVNLLCSAVSALIDDSLLDNQESKEQLREMKKKLDGKKEII